MGDLVKAQQKELFMDLTRKNYLSMTW